jgi:glycosyltransferase involved in cell wall biosynthesis
MWPAPGAKPTLPRLTLALPGSLEARTGGTTYDRRVVEALREDGWWVDVLEWAATFPFPSEDQRLEAAASLAALPDNALVMIDGLALGVLPGLARREMSRLRLVAMVHHPLALETGLSPMMAATFAAEERAALQCMRAVVVTSATTAAILEGAFNVPAEAITVAVPGVDQPAARSPRKPGPMRILALGQVSPRKAHDVLVDALSRIAELDWTCIIAGSLESDPETAEALAEQIDRLGLAERIHLVGEVDDQTAQRLYEEADLFALASLYEGYGMVFAEAMAHGLPIVATTGGALPEVVPPSAGVLVTPGEAEAFAQALAGLVTDPQRRAVLAGGARDVGGTLAGWDDTAATIAAVLERV